jgi:hypothetical protein
MDSTWIVTKKIVKELFAWAIFHALKQIASKLFHEKGQ